MKREYDFSKGERGRFYNPDFKHSIDQRIAKKSETVITGATFRIYPTMEQIQKFEPMFHDSPYKSIKRKEINFPAFKIVSLPNSTEKGIDLHSIGTVKIDIPEGYLSYSTKDCCIHKDNSRWLKDKNIWYASLYFEYKRKYDYLKFLQERLPYMTEQVTPDELKAYCGFLKEMIAFNPNLKESINKRIDELKRTKGKGLDLRKPGMLPISMTISSKLTPYVLQVKRDRFPAEIKRAGVDLTISTSNKTRKTRFLIPKNKGKLVKRRKFKESLIPDIANPKQRF